MSTGRRVLTAVVIAGATAGAVPASAGAQTCTAAAAYAGIQYEADLFTGQTTFDVQRVSASTAAAFTTITLKRTAAMTTAMTDTLVALATGAPCRR